MNRLLRLMTVFSLSLFISSVFANNLITLFPIQDYDQHLYDYIKPTDPNYNKPLISESQQDTRMNAFYQHDFGSMSPWSAGRVTSVLSVKPPFDLYHQEIALLAYFSNSGKSPQHIGYGENFRPHTQNWVNQLRLQMNLDTLQQHLYYNWRRRAITVTNLNARALPTTSVHFYSHNLAGQGYPFDNLQMSAVWAGTPLYVICQSTNHAWSLVITPSVIGWVKSSGVAYTGRVFVRKWRNRASKKLGAIIFTQTPVVSKRNRFRFLAYVGSVFPIVRQRSVITRIMIPIKQRNGKAVIGKVSVVRDTIVRMPFTATPHHFAAVMHTLLGRPYGWGGMYFYNDCSAELKSVYTPFGIWLPRHSSDQINEGQVVDKTLDSPSERVDYLQTHGHKLMTIVYIGGHVFMYMGNYYNSEVNKVVPMTYQNVWGLHPISGPEARNVIGKSVLFPLLDHYPDAPNDKSLAASRYFKVSFLDEWYGGLKQAPLNLKQLMYPAALLYGNH